MKSALVVDSASPGVPDLAADLATVGIRVIGTCSRDALVHEAIRLMPALVVCHETSVDEALFGACDRLGATAPHPVVVFTNDPDVEKIERAMRAGIHAYVVNGYDLDRLRAVTHLAEARFRHERALRAELAEIGKRFDERKLVDRAKGILMRARQVNEDEAFRVLRTASMHTNRRVGQVSQQVIEAAHYAEAVNRAGRLRMLAQRLVKLCALQALQPGAAQAPPATAAVGTGTPSANSQVADSQVADSIGQIDTNIAELGKRLSKATFGDLLEAVEFAWPPLREGVLAAPPNDPAADRTRLIALDRLGDALLNQAERLTRHLETAGLVTTLHVINVAGRQRMWSQRHAKQALLGVLLTGDAAQRARDDLIRTAAAFDQAMDYLKTIPLSTRHIRDALAAADTAWTTLQQAATQVRTARQQQVIAESSETLLALFDELTDQYERSMQVLMG